jgi:ribonuclease HI
MQEGNVVAYAAR